MDNKVAHTAEHAFIGSLQRLLGRTIEVSKVEHRDTYHTAFITQTDVILDFEKIMAAEMEVNKLIIEGRKVNHFKFKTLKEARKTIPHLRANEERLSDEKEISVVEIENHDIAACSMEHAENLSECLFFLVINMTKNVNNYEIKFMIGLNAMNEAVKLTNKIYSICNNTGANYNTIEETINKINKQRLIFSRILKNITIRSLEAIEPKYLGDNVKFIIKVLYDLDFKEIQKYVNFKVSEKRTVVILVNNTESDFANLIFARSNDLSINCIDAINKLADSINAGINGGGKPNFIIANINKSMSNVILEGLIEISLATLTP